MEGSRLRFPRLNLARSSAVQLTVFGAYESTDSRLSLLPTQLAPSAGNTTELGASCRVQYTVRGEPHTIYASLNIYDENEIHVNILYRTVPSGTSRRVRPSFSENTFLGTVEELGEPKEARALALFDYDDSEPHQLWFPLPVNLAGSSPDDVIEILGVRAVNRATGGDSQGYEFILDRPEEKQIALQIQIDFDKPITAGSPRLVFDRAKRIAQDLVKSV